MAWVRWRGGCAQLLATVWDHGRSRQVLLVNLQGAYAASTRLRAAVTAQFPTIPVDWAAVDRALAAGPPGTPALTPPQNTWATVAHDLRTWALATEVPSERGALDAAAAVLTTWLAAGVEFPPLPPP
ncbi:MAG: hypothetical protein ACP5PW_08425 [Candidatus Dormibacteria bacterium]